MKIFNNDGEKLKKYIQSDSLPVFLKVDLSLNRPDNRVEYELWYSSIFDLTKD